MVTPPLAQAPDHRPHVAAQLDVDPGGGLVEEQHARLVRQGLGDHHPALHAAGQRHDRSSPCGPTAKGRAAPSPDRRDRGGLPNRPRLKLTVAHTVSKASVVSSCGTRPIDSPRRAASRARCRGRRRSPASRGPDDAADDVDQRGLARAVGAQEGEDLALPNVEVDAFQRLEPRGVGLGQTRDRDDRRPHSSAVSGGRGGRLGGRIVDRPARAPPPGGR